MKTLIAVLILLLIPVSMPVRGEAVTLLEIDTIWVARDTVVTDSSWKWLAPNEWYQPSDLFPRNLRAKHPRIERVDTIPRTFIVPEWLAKLKPKSGYEVAQGSYRHWCLIPWNGKEFSDKPRVDTVIVHDTVTRLVPIFSHDTVRIVDTVCCCCGKVRTRKEK